MDQNKKMRIFAKKLLGVDLDDPSSGVLKLILERISAERMEALFQHGLEDLDDSQAYSLAMLAQPGDVQAMKDLWMSRLGLGIRTFDEQVTTLLSYFTEEEKEEILRETMPVDVDGTPRTVLDLLVVSCDGPDKARIRRSSSVAAVILHCLRSGNMSLVQEMAQVAHARGKEWLDAFSHAPEAVEAAVELAQGDQGVALEDWLTICCIELDPDN